MVPRTPSIHLLLALILAAWSPMCCCATGSLFFALSSARSAAPAAPHSCCALGGAHRADSGSAPARPSNDQDHHDRCACDARIAALERPIAPDLAAPIAVFPAPAPARTVAPAAAAVERPTQCDGPLPRDGATLLRLRCALTV